MNMHMDLRRQVPPSTFLALGILFIWFAVVLGLYLMFSYWTLLFLDSAIFLVAIASLFIIDRLPRWLLVVMVLRLTALLFPPSPFVYGFQIAFNPRYTSALMLFGEGFLLLIIGAILTGAKRKVSRRVLFTSAVCFFCLFLYFSTLTMLLPRIYRSEPLWIQEGIYAEYSISYSGRGPPSNLTYRWEIKSIKSDSVVIHSCGIKGSVVGENHTGEIGPSDGVYLGQRLWVTSYVNEYLVAFSAPDIEPWLKVASIEEFLFNGMSRRCYTFRLDEFPPSQAVLNHTYDVETGLLMKYFWATGQGQELWVLKSTNLDWTSIARSPTKPIIDFVLLTPLSLMPAASVFYIWRYRSPALGKIEPREKSGETP